MFENRGASDAAAILVELPSKKPGKGGDRPKTRPGEVSGFVKRFEAMSVADLTDLVDLLPAIIAASTDADLVFDVDVRCTQGNVSEESNSLLDSVDD